MEAGDRGTRRDGRQGRHDGVGAKLADCKAAPLGWPTCEESYREHGFKLCGYIYFFHVPRSRKI